MLYKTKTSHLWWVLSCCIQFGTLSFLHADPTDGHDHRPQLNIGDDYTQVSEDVSVRIPVLRNDYSVQAPLDTMSLDTVQGARALHGSVTVLPGTGLVLYTPDPDFFGLDSFVYQICTMEGACGQGKVKVIVHPVDDAPRAHDDSLTTAEDTPLTFDPTANDHNPDLDSNSFARLDLLAGPRHGDLKHDPATGWLIYMPDSNYYGPDHFSYYICDDTIGGLCDTANVRISVSPVNDPPVAADDRDTTWQGMLAIVQVLRNDHHGDGGEGSTALDLGSMTTEGLRQPKHGYTFVDTSVGMILYIPDDGFTGIDRFEYRVCELEAGDGNLCDTGLVEVVVLPGPPPSRN